SPTGPASSSSAPTRETRVERGEIVLRLPGDTAIVEATVDGQRTASPTLALASEQRWLGDAPVLDAAELAAGRIRAAAPGSAVLSVSAFGAAPAKVTVRVRPDRPLALSVAATAGAGADTITVRGYALGGARDAFVGSARATVLGGDSATLRLAVPSLDGASCAGAVHEALRIDGADVAAGLAVERRHPDALALPVGVPVRLSAAQARCLRLAPAAGAAYALAFLDTRLVRRAESGYEGSAPNPSTWTATIAEAGQTAPARGLLPRTAASAAGSDFRRDVSAVSSSPTARAVPWTEGERFALTDPSLAAPATARVVRVYGGHLVFAVVEGQEPEGGAAAWIARADSAFAALVRTGYPVYRAALTSSSPVTSNGSGQLLVVARREATAYLGTTASTTAGGRRVSTVFLNSAYAFSATGMLRTLAHEVAHAWQEEYAARQGAGSTGATAWALEGTADLLAWSILGREMGIGTLSNFDWAAAMGDPGRVSYALLAAGARGDVTAGYASAAGFGMDLLGRLARHGAGADAALAEVTRGMLEGWNGFDRFGGRGEGLARRMRAALDGGWTPEDALLRWTL
ncbi:MAG TPA: hypothetical protein VFQ39_17600, partial [Longimicrobium sp.]|nr:hypothetical protein [Longimicrobium sp.]